MIFVKQLEKQALSILVGNVAYHDSGSAIGLNVGQFDRKRVHFRVLTPVVGIKVRETLIILRLGQRVPGRRRGLGISLICKHLEA
jgi:hypothetical protein